MNQTKQTFQIVKIVPVHDDRDCITAWRSIRLPNAYETLACAQAFAGRMQDDDEVSVKVVPYGADAFDRRPYHPSVFGPRVAFDDCGF